MIKKTQAAFIVVIVFSLMGITMYLNQEEKTESLPIQEWCEVGVTSPDGTITYNGVAGETDLVVFATTEGAKLFGKCK